MMITFTRRGGKCPFSFLIPSYPLLVRHLNGSTGPAEPEDAKTTG